MIPREVIDEIVSRADIVDTINTYVTLKRAGSNYNGLCPFHSEKSPSFPRRVRFTVSGAVRAEM